MANISYLSIQYKIIIHAQAKTTLSSCGPFGHNRNRVSGMEAWHTLFYVHYVRMFFCIMLKSLFFLLFYVSSVGVLKEVLGYYYSNMYVHYKLALVENPDALTPTTTPFTLMPCSVD